MKKKSASSRDERAHFYFEGRVQGVGFRYTAEKVALDIGLTGWVKNLPDGRVEAVCEGPREKIEAFSEKLKTGPLGAHIRKVACDWQKPTGEFDDFTVEFHL
jgi:acylphosphatase